MSFERWIIDLLPGWVIDEGWLPHLALFAFLIGLRLLPILLGWLGLLLAAFAKLFFAALLAILPAAAIGLGSVFGFILTGAGRLALLVWFIALEARGGDAHGDGDGDNRAGPDTRQDHPGSRRPAPCSACPRAGSRRMISSAPITAPSSGRIPTRAAARRTPWRSCAPVTASVNILDGARRTTMSFRLPDLRTPASVIRRAQKRLHAFDEAVPTGSFWPAAAPGPTSRSRRSLSASAASPATGWKRCARRSRRQTKVPPVLRPRRSTTSGILRWTRWTARIAGTDDSSNARAAGLCLWRALRAAARRVLFPLRPSCGSEGPIGTLEPSRPPARRVTAVNAQRCAAAPPETQTLKGRTMMNDDKTTTGQHGGPMRPRGCSA